MSFKKQKKKFEEFKKDIPKDKVKNVIWYKFDLEKQTNINNVFKYLKKNFKVIDCMINCAMSANRARTLLTITKII